MFPVSIVTPTSHSTVTHYCIFFHQQAEQAASTAALEYK